MPDFSPGCIILCRQVLFACRLIGYWRRDISAPDYPGMYAEGGIKGGADTIIKATSDEYTLDDPNAGRITKSKFAEYLVGKKETKFG